MNPVIGAVVLSRDEERCIARCLDSVLAAGFDDVLVLDTGSADGTVDLVRGYGSDVRLHTIPWSDSFAAARNAGLDEVHADWAVFVDADEWIVRGSVRDQLPDGTTVALAPRIVDVTRGTMVEEVPRVLPAGPRVRYHGRVHEYPAVGGVPVDVRPIDLELHHDGYAPEVLQAKDKHQRNLALLRKSLAEDPDNPRWPFYAVRDGVSVLAPAEIEELCRRSARLGDAGYYRETLVKACYALTGHGRWPTVAKWCDDLPDVDGQYFRAMIAALSGRGAPEELQRTAAVREEETDGSGICPSGDHLDAVAALLIEQVHGVDAADEYRGVIEPWTDMFFVNSRPRRHSLVR